MSTYKKFLYFALVTLLLNGCSGSGGSGGDGGSTGGSNSSDGGSGGGGGSGSDGGSGGLLGDLLSSNTDIDIGDGSLLTVGSTTALGRDGSLATVGADLQVGGTNNLASADLGLSVGNSTTNSSLLSTSAAATVGGSSLATANAGLGVLNNGDTSLASTNVGLGVGQGSNLVNANTNTQILGGTIGVTTNTTAIGSGGLVGGNVGVNLGTNTLNVPLPNLGGSTNSGSSGILSGLTSGNGLLSGLKK